MNRRLVYMPIDEVAPAERNPKGHAMDAIGASMARFGYTEPVLLDERTGRLVAGHGRLELLRSSQAAGQPAPDGVRVAKGTWLVPVIRGWASQTDAEAEAYLIASNRLVELGGWDNPQLAGMLTELLGTDLLEVSGYDRADLDELLAGIKPPPEKRTDEDEVPPPPAVPVTQSGDLWILGPHRLLCGDATSPPDVETLMAGAHPTLIYTDPPYGVAYIGGSKKRPQIAGDASVGDALQALFNAPFEAAANVGAAKCAVMVWHAHRRATPLYLAALRYGWECRAQIIWRKNQAQFGALGAQYHQLHEPLLYLVRAAHPPKWNGPTNEVTVWDADRASRNEWHPTQKPVCLAERAVRNHTDQGDAVLDLFGGSGSTLIAAHLADRAAYLLEIDPVFCDVILQRYADHTGGVPVHATTGELFRPRVPTEAGVT